MHLLIPFAAAEGCAAQRRSLRLPRLERLLARLAPAGTDAGDEFTLSPPHERALAALLGIAGGGDGRLPWAAHALAATGADPGTAAWAHVTPCHWRIAPDHIAMTDPAGLQLEEEESRALLAVVAPYFVEDGIALDYVSPLVWRARGEPLRGLATASLDRVTGRSLDLWMPDAPAARPLRRLQSEFQMLLYTHPLTDARTERGLPPVNAFWLSGSGDWPAGASTTVPGLRMPQTLRDTALRDDWTGWAAAWQQLDGAEVAEALAAAEAGQPVTLTLCGERNAQSWRSAPQSGWDRLKQQFSSFLGRKPLLHADLSL